MPFSNLDLTLYFTIQMIACSWISEFCSYLFADINALTRNSEKLLVSSFKKWLAVQGLAAVLCTEVFSIFLMLPHSPEITYRVIPSSEPPNLLHIRFFFFFLSGEIIRSISNVSMFTGLLFLI